jgi:hypothetical protein
MGTDNIKLTPLTGLTGWKRGIARYVVSTVDVPHVWYGEDYSTWLLEQLNVSGLLPSPPDIQKGKLAKALKYRGEIFTSMDAIETANSSERFVFILNPRAELEFLSRFGDASTMCGNLLSNGISQDARELACSGAMRTRPNVHANRSRCLGRTLPECNRSKRSLRIPQFRGPGIKVYGRRPVPSTAILCPRPGAMVRKG